MPPELIGCRCQTPAFASTVHVGPGATSGDELSVALLLTLAFALAAAFLGLVAATAFAVFAPTFAILALTFAVLAAALSVLAFTFAILALALSVLASAFAFALAGFLALVRTAVSDLGRNRLHG